MENNNNWNHRQEDDAPNYSNDPQRTTTNDEFLENDPNRNTPDGTAIENASRTPDTIGQENRFENFNDTDPNRYTGSAGSDAAAPGDEDEDENDEENQDDAGDWGHIDPAEGNSPFPDSNDPSGPGSAV